MKKLMALNRGEIAIRILRAANELGLQTVAVYSGQDRLSLHRFKADEAYQIGIEKGPVEAYLDIEGAIRLALDTGVDAVHPGYGFLAENPALASACEKVGLTFVGPDAKTLEILGDKTSARRIAVEAGVPVVPGTEHSISSKSEVEAVATEIGFPLIVKAAFGGGGRGMRIVDTPEELASKLEEAQMEAAAAFGNRAVFVERFIRRARHIEVQILGDQYGNVIHLHERDCTVQRRHQKVIEVAPAQNLDPKIKREICDAALRIARQVRYRNAGTVEFLLDADSNEWFFIEVNPRIQVEHTVTEEITGVDLVSSQIQIAQGAELFGEELGLPKTGEEIQVSGHALQCRVTTEDPDNNFVPDYGRLTTYRSPAGFGIRLDGASAYGGAVITPYYDSLLVKVTARARTFKQACDRMDRALREFRIRGVRTNIPFLENVVNHQAFQNGAVTTSFLDETRELFRFTARRDRATRLMTYLGEVIVNGNPEMKGRKPPLLTREAPVPSSPAGSPPPGTRQLLDQMGAEKFAEWTREQKHLLITDTTFRDAHQSLMATRMRTHDMMRIARFVAHEMAGLYSLEMWGGATFDVALRFLREDPWHRLDELRETIPNICFQMLLRASNAVGYTAYPDNVVQEFIAEAAVRGIDIFRIFDSLNYLPNMQISMEATRKTGKICEAAICYTGDILDQRRDKYSLRYYIDLARELERMGAHILAIKDMAGLVRPYAAEKLVKALREEIGLPIHFHTHDTSGLNAASILKAAEAGADVADAALGPMSGTTSQPNLNSLVAALSNTERETGLKLESLDRAADYWEVVREWYQPFDEAPRTGTAEVYLHEMPGGQFTNLKAQAAAMGLGDRWPQVARTYADVNMAFGDIVKVTPSSKVVGDLALFLVTHGISVKDFEQLGPDHRLTIPNSVIDMFMGSLGLPPGGWPDRISQLILQGRKPIGTRPGANLEPADMEAVAAELKKKISRIPSSGDILSYLLYPEVFAKYEEERKRFGDLSTLPTRQFFYGMKQGDEISVEIEQGKTLIIKYLTMSEPHDDGTRSVFFELNGQPRSVTVRDHSLEAKEEPREKADPGEEGHVGAPIPGAVTSIAVESAQQVHKGDKLLVMEAMKMQTTVYAPVSGRITRIPAQVGQHVEPKDLLLVIG
ncbi:MAG: pyruvate carboxylase [Acidobacteriota bacterium]|nr:MAG: pyruvate carboxylase [Acidobacteriota bacterium]